MDSNEVQVFEGSAEIRMARSPETVLAEAKLCAKALGRMVEQTKAFTVVGGRKHLHFTAWQTLGTMFRLAPRVKETRLIEADGIRGWECTAEVLHIPSGQIVSTADSMCTNDEANWSVRPKYEWKNGQKTRVGEEAVPLFQLRSMAQTRACAKALRNVISWVVVLAGYEATAAEEMTGNENEGGFDADGNQQQPQRKTESNGGGNGNGGAGTISDNHASRLGGIGHGAGKSKDQIIAVIKHFGFATAKDVTVDKYDALCAEIGRSDAA